MYSTVDEDVLMAYVSSSEFTQAQIMISIDNGANWTIIPFEEIENVGSDSADFVFNQGSIDVYFATYDLGAMKYVVDTTILGVSDTEISQSALIVSPNPADEYIQLELTNGLDVIQIGIYDMTGKLMLVSRNSSVNVTSLSSGVYLVRTLDNQGTVFISRLIKN